MTKDFAMDIYHVGDGPLLAPARGPNRRVGHVNRVDWSTSPIALRFGISGETKGGPRRKLPRAA